MNLSPRHIPQLDEASPAGRVFCVGTHHKTGTVWMRKVWKAIAWRLKMRRGKEFPDPDQMPRDQATRYFLPNWSSIFPPEVLDRPDCRIFHLIRDPRDVLLSGVRYHKIAQADGEPFLHIPRADLNGQTYQTHLKSLSPEDQLRFEMQERHQQTLDEMMAWDYNRPNTFELKYERLMQDTQGWFFKRTLKTMGFSQEEAGIGRRLFLRHSLFSAEHPIQSRSKFLERHIHDGSVAQWQCKLPRRIAEEYAERHGPALVALGYEDHPTAWLKKLAE